MLSMRARIVRTLLLNRNLFSFKQHKDIDWNSYESIVDFRKEVEDGAERFGKLPPDISVNPVIIGNLYAEWICPAHPRGDRVMLYFHGGGYVSGTCAAHRSIVSKFVKGSNVKALLFEYRLAPENRYPAALDDALAAYGWLLDQGFSPSSVVFAGDSAGAGLCLATLLAIRDKGIPLPVVAVVLSPYTDLLCTGESHITNAKRCLSPQGTPQAFAQHYAGDTDLVTPYISPLYGDLQGLPPILIFVGSDEVMRDDSIMFAQKAELVGVNITLRVGEGLFHCYPATAPLFPEATQAMQEICTFITSAPLCTP